MEKRTVFRGVGTALVTPMKDGVIDYKSLSGLIEMQIKAGVGAIVIGGTTGEAATLSDDERYRLYAFTAERISGRCPLIFGTGTNDTKSALRHTALASSVGCDGILTVTPYYNKGTEDGIIAHFLSIAEASRAPVLLYNVPSRTGVNLSIKALYRLSECENITGIKEADDSAERLIELSALSDRLSLYAGNDSALYTTLSLGGAGVISVLSNAYPHLLNRIYESFTTGDREGALREQRRILPIIKAMFFEVNPAPIKYVLSRLGLIRNELRLPMSVVSWDAKEKIDRLLAEFDLS